MNRAFVAGLFVLAVVGAHCNSDSNDPSADGDGGSPSNGDGSVLADAGPDGTSPQSQDTTPPTFAGVKAATALDEAHVAVTWDPATDDHAQQGTIAYRIYAGTAKGAEDFGAP